MSTTTPRPTLETADVFDAYARCACGTAYIRLKMEKLERERDEAREYTERCKQGCIKLSFAIDRIDYACGEPNEMEVSDYCVHQNEEHVVKRVKEKLEAMREAIREARELLVSLEYEGNEKGTRCISCGSHCSESHKEGCNMLSALAKLQPFLKP